MLLLSASADTTIRLYLINAKKVESIISGRSFLQIPYKSFFHKSIQNITEISSRMNWPRLRWYSLLLFSLENGIRDLKKKNSLDKVSTLEARGFPLIIMILVTQSGT